MARAATVGATTACKECLATATAAEVPAGVVREAVAAMAVAGVVARREGAVGGVGGTGKVTAVATWVALVAMVACPAAAIRGEARAAVPAAEALMAREQLEAAGEEAKALEGGGKEAAPDPLAILKNTV